MNPAWSKPVTQAEALTGCLSVIGVPASVILRPADKLGSNEANSKGVIYTYMCSGYELTEREEHTSYTVAVKLRAAVEVKL